MALVAQSVDLYVQSGALMRRGLFVLEYSANYSESTVNLSMFAIHSNVFTITTRVLYYVYVLNYCVTR